MNSFGLDVKIIVAVIFIIIGGILAEVLNGFVSDQIKKITDSSNVRTRLFVIIFIFVLLFIILYVSTNNNQTPSLVETSNKNIEHPPDELTKNMRIIYETSFNNNTDYKNNWQEQEYGNVKLIDGQLRISGLGSGVSHLSRLQEGNVILVLFSYDVGTDGNIVFYDQEKSKYVGIKPNYTSGIILSIGYNNEFHTGNLRGNLVIEANKWYYAYLEIVDGGNFNFKVCHIEDINNCLEKILPMGSDWDNQLWNPSFSTNQYNRGTLIIESYYELEYK